MHLRFLGLIQIIVLIVSAMLAIILVAASYETESRPIRHLCYAAIGVIVGVSHWIVIVKTGASLFVAVPVYAVLAVALLLSAGTIKRLAE